MNTPATATTEQSAVCRNHPDAYELPSVKTIDLRGQQWLARKGCGDCPLLASCASYALDTMAKRPDTWEGMIIAGVPFPNHLSKAYRGAGRKALRLVAAGASLIKAHDVQERAVLK